VSVAVVLGLLPAVAAGQYLYMDANGDGVYTSSDVLRFGETLPVDIWIRTDAGRTGPTQQPPACLTIFSYEFVIRAEGGKVEWGEYTNHMSAMPVRFGPRSTQSEYYDGYAGTAGLPPGRYKLGRLMVRVLAGSPSLSFQPRYSAWPALLTSFGSDCPGKENDHTLKLGAVGGGSPSAGTVEGDWSDAEGLAAGATGTIKLERGEQPLPVRFSIEAPRTAPVSGRGVSFRVGLPSPGHLTLRVFDVQGRLVGTVMDAELPSGWHDLSWGAESSNGNTVASGIYFARGQWSGKTASRKFTLAR
jgi:hypothetical protein